MNLFIFFFVAIIASCSFYPVALTSTKSYDWLAGHKIYEYGQRRNDESERILYSNWDGKDQTKKDALLFLQGSGCKSILRKRKNNSGVSVSVLNEFIKLSPDNYWYFAFEKRGVSPFDLGTGKGNTDKCSDEYNKFISWENRIQDTLEVLKLIEKLKVVNSKRIVLVGYSEGTDVVIGVLNQSTIPTHAGYFVGGGTTQMFDLLVLARKYYFKEISDSIEKEKKIEEYLATFEEIMKNPNVTTKFFLGHSYQRWASFFKNEPDKLFLKVDIPVFLAHGTEDESVPIESIDYLQTQMILNNKKNITFRRYPGLNHALAACRQDDLNCMDIDEKYKHTEIFGEFLKWIEKR